MGATKAETDREADDMASLMRLPSFRRFLWRIVDASGIHASAYGSDERRLSAVEGRRSLGFDVLRWADESQRIGSGNGMASLMQILIEASAATPPSETQNARRTRTRIDELRDDADDDEPVRS